MAKKVYMLFSICAVLMLAGFATADDSCHACTGSQRLQSCKATTGSTHCFCTISNGNCSATGCPCHTVGTDPPLAECFCPIKIVKGAAVSTARSVDEVKAEKIKEYSDTERFNPHQMVVVHTCKHGAKDQPNEVLGMVDAASETGHPITFTTLDDNEAPPELVGK